MSEHLPSATGSSPSAQDLLSAARACALIEQLPYAGRLPAVEAWSVVQAGHAVLVDVRTAEEVKFVGRVPGSVHVPWMTGTALLRNPRFVRELEAKVGKDQPVLLLCRSGKRSADAATAAHKAGFTQVFNVTEGFEGELDDAQQRGHQNGWRFSGLPWIQD